MLHSSDRLPFRGNAPIKWAGSARTGAPDAISRLTMTWTVVARHVTEAAKCAMAMSLKLATRRRVANLRRTHAMADFAPAAKRPRVGRRPEDVLPAIEGDTRENEISHRLRAMLLHVGEPRFDDEGVDVSLRRQAVVWGEAVQTAADDVLAILFDG